MSTYTLTEVVTAWLSSGSRRQTKQGPIVGANQGLIQPVAELLLVDLSPRDFGEHDSAHEYLASRGGLALALRLHRPFAGIEPLLAKLQLMEFLLQGRNLIV
jgi:hypothetical protein